MHGVHTESLGKVMVWINDSRTMQCTSQPETTCTIASGVGSSQGYRRAMSTISLPGDGCFLVLSRHARWALFVADLLAWRWTTLRRSGFALSTLTDALHGVF